MLSTQRLYSVAGPKPSSATVEKPRVTKRTFVEMVEGDNRGTIKRPGDDSEEDDWSLEVGGEWNIEYDVIELNRW